MEYRMRHFQIIFNYCATILFFSSNISAIDSAHLTWGPLSSSIIEIISLHEV